MRRYTKLLSVIMSAMMIVSSVPFSAIAEEDVYETSVADIIEEETGESPGGLSEVLTEESAEESEEASVEEENVETESSEVHEDPVEEESSQPEEGTTPSEESSETSEEVSDTIDGESSEESGEVSTEESSEESGEVPAEESYEESGETSDTESSEEENLEAEEETEAEEGKNSEDITDIPEGLNYYKADETEVIISSYEGDEPELIIPATIEGLPVTAIDEWAFDENEVITSVTLPESVTSIGDYAFFACINLEYINTQAVTDIGEKAFWGCKKLADVNGLVIVNNVVYDFAFGEKEGLLDVVIPDSVTEIVEEAFNSVQNIRSVTTSAGNIGASAFKDCMKLTTLTLKEGVETIGVGAFYNCNLAAVHIPSSVRTIGDSAFSLNKNLKSLTFDYGIDTIGSSAFSNCQHIEKIVFPSSLTTIGDYAFSICSYLKEITVPSSITFVGEGAFLGCSQTVTAHISCMSTLSESDIGDNIKADIVHLGEIETAFTWDGVSTCTIEIHCKECNVTESKNCDITSAVTKKATTETVGTTTYTASYTVGDKSYTDSKSLDNIPVMEYTAPTAKTLTYTGSAQTLVNAGKTNGGTLQYSTDGKTYTTGLPKKTSVGIYKVYYKVVGNESYNSVSAKYITVKIVPQKAVISSCANISTGIKLTWGKVTGATGYEVYRGSSKIATVTSGSTVTYTDTAVKTSANRTAYTYYVRAFYKNSAGTVIYGAKSAGKATRRMQTPSISSYANTSTGIKITWGAQSGATGYVVYRDGVKIKATTATSYTDISDTVAKAANGKAFKYTVKSYYKTSSGTYYYSGSSAAKTAYRVKAPASLTVATGMTYATLKFSTVPSGMGYQIYRATSQTGTYSLIKTVSAGTASYKNTGLTPNKNYYYKVRAYRTINNVKVYSAYKSIKATTKPVVVNTVTGLKVSEIKFDSIKLNWSKVTNANGYQIYRSTSKTGTYSKVKTVTGGSTVTWKDTGVKLNKTYYYKVRAYRTVGGKNYYGSYATVYGKTPNYKGMKNIDGYLYCFENGTAVKNGYSNGLYFGADGRYTSGNKELDKLIAGLIVEKTNNTMSQMDKFRVLYNYVRDEFSYLPMSFIDVGATGWERDRALEALGMKRGNCYSYSAAVTMLARGLGYNAASVSGYAFNYYSRHGWTEIFFDGQKYVFDAQIEGVYCRKEGYDWSFFMCPFELGVNRIDYAYR